MKKLFYKWLSWATSFIGLAFLSVAAHETSHLVAAKMWGVGGEIHFHVIGGVFFPDATAPWPIYLAGGMGAALFLMILFWLVPRFTKSKNDTYLEIAAVSAAITNMLYSWWEIKVVGEGWWIWGFLGNIVLALVFLYYNRRRYIHWLFNGYFKD